jgi:hypothetical protein
MGFMASTHRRLALAATAVLAAALAGGARPAAAPQLLTLNPITIANGTAIVSGTVGGGSAASAQLSVNGHPLIVDGGGAFAGAVNLNGASVLRLSLSTPVSGKPVVFEIRLSAALLLYGGVVPAGVLDAVQQAGARLLEPLGGFHAVAGQPLTISGTVLDRDKLVSLTVNGKDVLTLLGGDNTFTTQLPGTTKEVSLTARDSQGVTQTTQYRVVDTAAPLATQRTLSIAANQAIGVRIAKIRYFAKRVARTKRIWMVVIVKDRRGYLVRGAKLTVRSKARALLRRRIQAKKSNKTGRATFVLRVTPRALGRRLVMVTVARTPAARAAKTSSVRLARAARTSRHRT